MKKIFLILIFLSISFFVFAEHRVIKVGVWNNPPLSIIQDEKFNGLAPEIFRYIAEKEGIDYIFVKDNFNNLLEKIKSNEIDIMLPIGYSKQRLQFMGFSEDPIFTNWGVIIANDSQNINSILELENKKIALKENDIFYVGENGLKSILNSFKITYTAVKGEDYPEIAKLVADKKADVGLISRIYTPYVKFSNVKVTDIVLMPITVHFAFSRNLDTEIAKKINYQLKELINDKDSFYYQTLDRLFEKRQINYKMLYKTLVILLLIIFIAFITIIFFKYQVNLKTKELKILLNKELEAKNKLESFINAMPDVAFVLDKDGTYIEIFSSNDDLLYDTKENILGKKLSEILPQNLSDTTMNAINKCLLDKTTYKFEYELDVIGGKKIFEGRVTPISKFDDNEYVLLLAIDLTDSKNLEDKIKYDRDRFHTILKSIADAVLVVDKDKKITFINKAAEKILEKPYVDVVGKLFSDEIILKSNDDNPYHLPFDDIFNKGYIGKLVTDCKLINKNGKVFLVDDSISPLYDANSNIDGAVIVFSDVTIQKKMEKEISKKQHLESIGRLAGGIAHDFNNYLAAISSYVSMYKITNDKPDEQILNSIESILKRATSLTKQLLTFSKGGAPVKKPENIRDILEETTNFVLSGTSVVANFNYENNLPAALIDSDQFSQVITNIIINSKEAMNNKGRIDINVRNILFPDLNEFNLPQGSYLEISIRDYGHGIPEDIKDKIFEPFFTTKANGTGLGLAISYSIINQHGGRLFVYSEPGKGAEFKILIKAAKNFGTSPVEKTSINKKYDLKILYLDDDESLRDSFNLLLNTLGCEVDLAKNGEEALELFNKNNYNLAILDLTIKGGMGGLETANEILKYKKDAYLVVTSGYADDSAIANYKNYGFKDYLSKPFNLKNILDILENYTKIADNL